jgi:hypothetical protein
MAETSMSTAIFCVGAYRNVAVAGAFVVSDELYHESWRPGFSERAFKENSRHLVQEVLKGVRGHD